MEECKVCQRKTIDGLIKRFQPDDELKKQFVLKANAIIDEGDGNSPLLATQLQRLAKKSFNCEDIYSNEKQHANELLFSNYDYWKSNIGLGRDSFHRAVKMAVSGNIIDYGAHSVPDDILAHVKELHQREFAIDHSERLYTDISNAKSILYLGDNAGEIVFDRLLIETMNQSNVTFAVRGEAVINDVTMLDASQVKMEEVCTVIDNGFDAPSTILEACSSEFQKIFNEADLIISKGQGNFEGLMNNDQKNICFMLMAKCDLIARKLGVKKGDMVVKYLND
ncbi:DUF89 family protein [Prolixibacteraceae bacterium JC049]|nr:DUF89 family protein [Prolixibacteraceae bacterium JC049]